MSLREEVARLIDPFVWSLRDEEVVTPALSGTLAESLDKAAAAVAVVLKRLREPSRDMLLNGARCIDDSEVGADSVWHAMLDQFHKEATGG